MPRRHSRPKGLGERFPDRASYLVGPGTARDDGHDHPAAGRRTAVRRQVAGGTEDGGPPQVGERLLELGPQLERRRAQPAPQYRVVHGDDGRRERYRRRGRRPLRRQRVAQVVGERPLVAVRGDELAVLVSRVAATPSSVVERVMNMLKN